MNDSDPKDISDPITDIVPRGLTAERSDVRVFYGYYNVEASTWRLYRTLDLNEYLEGRTDDLVHVEHLHLASEEHPLRGTVIWVRADASIERCARFQLDSPWSYYEIKVTAWCPRPHEAVTGWCEPPDCEEQPRRRYMAKKGPPVHTSWC